MPRYTRVAVALHWTIALLIVVNLVIGPFMEGLAEPWRTLIVRLHQSSGITILVLTVFRILWRLSHQPPPLAARVGNAERLTAKVVHVVLYVAMVGLPLSGWALISANPPRFEAVAVNASSNPASEKGAPRPRQKMIRIWGLVPLVPIKPIQDIALEPGGNARQHELHEAIVTGHAIAGYTLLALLVLHILGALKHEWLDRTPQLYRMSFGNLRDNARQPAVPRDEDVEEADVA